MKSQFVEFENVMKEYFTCHHAEEVVPPEDLEKSQQEVFYMPVHALRMESSRTTKSHAVFDAFTRMSTGISLNDILMINTSFYFSGRFDTYPSALCSIDR